ncbi:MAG: hypothetical protein J7L89_00670, partial [Bacteroidales bacterium]|nr:hypothetical protein [Bacteroidales bacterium]
ELYLTYDNIVKYMELLDQASDRVSLIHTGYSYEHQPLLLVVITSRDNQQNLEKLRTDHLATLDAAHPSNAIRNTPMIVWLGYSIHGNEASGGNATPLLAYYLAAAEDQDIVKMLDQSIILIDPCLNPDGFNRFASWVNPRRSITPNPDANSFEFSEPWPGGRTNHYWFDLNRDWLLLQNPESRARVAQFHRWMPQILTDHHEMGNNSTFFFQPGVKSRSNPVVPDANFALTQKIGLFHAKALDQIGSLYFTEEVFDDFYFGKGSSYPDVNGSIGILFEQAGSRGQLRQTSRGTLSFAFTIRNQIKVSLSTLKASQALSKELKYNQVDFFRTAWEESKNAAVKGYLFGDPDDPYRTNMMIDLLQQHRISVFPLNKPAKVDSILFKPGKSFFVPTHQLQYRMVRTLFERPVSFNDPTFYDVSAWTLPLAMNIPYTGVDAKTGAKLSVGKSIEEITPVQGELIGSESSVGYLFSCDPYMVHKVLYELLSAGIQVRQAGKSFAIYQKNRLVRFGTGTLFVPVQSQPVSSYELYQLLEQMAVDNGLSIYATPTGYTSEGPDLGSGQFAGLTIPKILCLTGGSVSSREVGEIWHLLDTRFMIPITLTDINRFSRINLNDYNTLFLAGGSYRELTAKDLDKLRDWIRSGGTVISIRSAASFLSKAGIIKLTPLKKPAREEREKIRPYDKQRADRTGWSIPGTIFNTTLDTTHPVAYGYHRSSLPVFKSGSSLYALPDNPYENIAVYTSDPLLAGYAPPKLTTVLSGSSAIQRQSFGRGHIIIFFDDPLFRGFWTGEHKLLLNAIFWGDR